MKYLFISILFLLPCLASAQSKKFIDGFMDISFGSDSATVKAAIFAKGGMENSPLSSKDCLALKNFSMSQKPVDISFVDFMDNKAYSARFFFEADDSVVFSVYNDFVNDITAVYGKISSIDEPDGSNNAIKIHKIRSGAICQTLWESKNKNTLTVSIVRVNQSLEVLLQYRDRSLSDLNAAKRRSDL